MGFDPNKAGTDLGRYLKGITPSRQGEVLKKFLKGAGTAGTGVATGLSGIFRTAGKGVTSINSGATGTFSTQADIDPLGGGLFKLDQYKQAKIFADELMRSSGAAALPRRFSGGAPADARPAW